MTNSTSLSTRHLWHSRHTTSPQYVVKVGIPQEVVRSIIPKSISYSISVFFFFSLVPRNQLLSVAAACKVLIEFSLMRLENPDEACAVSQVRNSNCRGEIQFKGNKSAEDPTIVLFILPQKHLILLIKGLCTGCSRLDRTEIITFTAMMKSAKLPQTVKTLSDGACLIEFTSVLVILRNSIKIIPSLFGIFNE